MEDYSTVIERYGEAAKRGDAAAMSALGQVLLAEGISYLTSSARYGNNGALDILEELLSNGHDRLQAAKHSISQQSGIISSAEMAVGNIVKLGRMPLREESIEWQILDIQDDRVLLLSKYVLEYRPFLERWGLGTWESSSLRKYLNGEFLQEVFSQEERHCLLKSLVKADENPMCNTDPGNDTKDIVFLLSVVEAQKYFPANYNRKCMHHMGGRKPNARTSWWWLRSPGFNEANAASVGDDGSFQYSYVQDVRGGVRPAVWLKL